MPAFKLLTFWGQLQSGWTETYYRIAGNAKEATDWGGLDGYLPHLRLRDRACELQAVRAQETEGLRRIYLDLVGAHGALTGTPSVPGLAAYCWLSFEGGYGRPLYLRGLPDEWLRRAESGADDPPAALTAALRDLLDGLRRLDLRGRLRDRSEEYHDIHTIGPHPDSPTLTLAETRDGWTPRVGDYVAYGGTWRVGPQLDRPYLVVEVSGGVFATNAPWQIGLGDQAGVDVRVKKLAYHYPRFEALEFRRFTRRATGSRFWPASWEALHPRRVGLSTCGRIVDMLRSGYEADMRFRLADPAAIEPVRWYRPTRRLDFTAVGQVVTDEPPTSVIPYPHPFGSRKWDEEEFPPAPLGETYMRRPDRGRQKTILSGRGLVGTAEEWANGVRPGKKPPKFSRRTGWP